MRCYTYTFSRYMQEQHLVENACIEISLLLFTLIKSCIRRDGCGFDLYYTYFPALIEKNKLGISTHNVFSVRVENEERSILTLGCLLCYLDKKLKLHRNYISYTIYIHSYLIHLIFN